MRKIWSLLVLVMVFGWCFSPVFGAAQEFSANVTITDAQGVVATGRIFVKDFQKIREEVMVQGNPAVMIIRMDRKVMWSVMDQTMYAEMTYGFNPYHPNPGLAYTTAALDKETVNGRECTVTQYTYQDVKYGVLLQWVDAADGALVRAEAKDSTGKVTGRMELSNIKPGPQPDYLFEVPTGARRVKTVNIPGLK